MKACGGSGCVYPRILDLGTRWRWVVSFTPRPLYPLDSRWGWAPEPAWTTWRREKISPSPALELRPLHRPTRNQSLYRLSYPGNKIQTNPSPVGLIKRGPITLNSFVNWLLDFSIISPVKLLTQAWNYCCHAPFRMWPCICKWYCQYRLWAAITRSIWANMAD
jgi:hypothetical protein